VKRVFLVGCPRSGTTLVQALVASHPDVVSFPETHFFRSLSPRSRVPRRLGLASPRALRRLGEFTVELGRPELAERLSPALTVRGATRTFVRLLDGLAHEHQAETWLEKTPAHLHHIGRITRLVSGARFVHVVRNGEDVVASLYQVTREYPDVWGGPRSLDDCVDRWLRDVEITRRFTDHPHHLVVRYEEAVEQPERVLERLCRFLDLDFDEAILTNQQAAAAQVVLRSEPWKQRARLRPALLSGRKFDELLDNRQRRYVSQRLHDLGGGRSGW
jgi:hypothetical protein